MARGLIGAVLFSTGFLSSMSQGRAQEPPQEGLRPRAHVQVGLNPHQIAFSPDGRRAYVAVAGSDRVTVVDTETFRIRASLDVEGTPLGVAVLDGGAALAVTRFSTDRVARIGAHAGALLDEIQVGGGPSLLVGPFPESRFLVSSERTHRLLVLDASTFELTAAVPVGERPFPPHATTNGRVALVPAYDDGTVARVDLPEGRVVWTVPVGVRPSGGAVLPGDTLYAVAVRGEDRVALLDLRTGRVRGDVREGIGREPFSVVTHPLLGVAFVNNTASHDLSVLELSTLRIVERVPVPEIPIVMAVHPDGASLWVSSEGDDGLTVLAVPEAYRVPATGAPPQPAGSDIWVADLRLRNGIYALGTPVRVTDRPGYDNQPHFLPDGDAFLYTSIDAAGQADIWRADVESGTTEPFTRTAPESEYSPTPLPDGTGISVVRVEADSAQRLWRFDWDGQPGGVLFPDLEPVGYHAWIDDGRVAAYVLDDPPELRIADLGLEESRPVAQGIGRSLHFVADRRALSYVQFDDRGRGSVRLMDVGTGVVATLTPVREESQDMAWTPGGVLLMAEGSQLHQWTASGGWQLVADLSPHGLEGITRLAVSPRGDRVALVAER